MIKFPSNENILVHHINDISLEDAAFIEMLIKEENKNKKHMLEKTATQIQLNVSSYSWIIAKFLENPWIIWYMGLERTQYKFKDIDMFERGSLIIDPAHRWIRLWSFLRTYLLEKNNEKCIYTVTNVPKVIKENEIIWEFMLTQEQIKKTAAELYDVIQTEGAFYEDDVVFVNQTLFDLIHK